MITSSGAVTTEGDHYNLACPMCGKINHYVGRGHNVPLGKSILRTLECFHCKKKMKVVLTWALVAKAEPYGVFEDD